MGEQSTTTSVADEEGPVLQGPVRRRKISKEELDNVTNYLAISIDWSNNIILPYKDGMAFLAALEKAERIKKYYSHEKLQFSQERLEITTTIITQAEYREQKMSHLLEIDQ